MLYCFYFYNYSLFYNYIRSVFPYYAIIIINLYGNFRFCKNVILL